jgi:hypothetical protein
MNAHQVPQDNSPTYCGQRRMLYATDSAGRYRQVQSTGWAVEADATTLALEEQRRQTRRAWEEARAGRASPMKYYMLRQRMDVAGLAQATRLWKWRVRRHFRPAIFAKLKDSVLTLYSNALGIPVGELRQTPDTPDVDVRVPSEPPRCRP